jgi:hypothetical protein
MNAAADSTDLVDGKTANLANTREVLAGKKLSSAQAPMPNVPDMILRLTDEHST